MEAILISIMIVLTIAIAIVVPLALSARKKKVYRAVTLKDFTCEFDNNNLTIKLSPKKNIYNFIITISFYNDNGDLLQKWDRYLKDVTPSKIYFTTVNVKELVFDTSCRYYGELSFIGDVLEQGK